jgi:hypothetical protein
MASSMKRFDGSDSRWICSPNLITATHENVPKPIHTVFVGKEIRVDVLQELPFDAIVDFIFKSVKPA